MADRATTCFCAFIPPHIYRHLSGSTDARARAAGQRGIELSERLRGQRDMMALMPAMSATPGKMRRTMFDAGGQTALPGTNVRGEDGPVSADAAVEAAFARAGIVWSFYKTVFGRDSLDNRGARLDSTVHYGQSFGNAVWNGTEMVYGDGDENLHNFTTSLDVIAHEMTHGVTGSASGLVYNAQSGALNEHISDVFGVLALQFDAAQNPANYPNRTPAQKWLLGTDVIVVPNPLPAGASARAVRDMLNPGTAYSGLLLGDDAQVAHMDDLFTDAFDNFGVHINSGIPNRAFALFAEAVGGNAWELPGKVWYRASTASGLSPNAQFADFRTATLDAAKIEGADVAQLTKAWDAVGVSEPKTVVAVPAAAGH
jgi:Zn-dependent metalloprotease